MTATGVRLRRGDLTADVDRVGGTLLDIRANGCSLLAGPRRVAPELGHHGAVLAPWPNRVAGGHYVFAGSTLHLPINDALHGHAIHGFAYEQEWTVTGRSVAGVTLATTLGPTPGYPFRVAVELRYRIERDRLACLVNWTNVGVRTAPFGIGFHPYLRPGPSPLDTWRLEVPASVAMESDAVTKLPGQLASVAGTAADYRSARPIGPDRFSRAYRLAPHSPGAHAVVRLWDPTGSGLELEVSEAFGWLQVFTADLPSPELHRRGLAVEPESCPPNAFVTGQDLIQLQPGESGGARWWLRQIGSPRVHER